MMYLFGLLFIKDLYVKLDIPYPSLPGVCADDLGHSASSSSSSPYFSSPQTSTILRTLPVVD
jgi:hypothetical protein